MLLEDSLVICLETLIILVILTLNESLNVFIKVELVMGSFSLMLLLLIEFLHFRQVREVLLFFVIRVSQRVNRPVEILRRVLEP